MEQALAWFNSLSPTLGLIVNVLVIAIVILTTFTLLAGMWIGFCIARKRSRQIAEIEFFPPRIIFKQPE
jgi:positive regulator of sigma E activity